MSAQYSRDLVRAKHPAAHAKHEAMDARGKERRWFIYRDAIPDSDAVRTPLGSDVSEDLAWRNAVVGVIENGLRPGDPRHWHELRELVDAAKGGA